jgi:hypothetical protein
MTFTLDAVAFYLGYSLIVLFCIAVVVGLVFALVEFAGIELFKRMRRLYHLSSIAYWLHHYEERGRKCFLDPDPAYPTTPEE